MSEARPLLRRDRGWHPPAYAPAYKSSVLRSPRRALLSIEPSMEDMSGPVFGRDMLDPLDNDLIRNFGADGEAVGERIVVHGRVLDEAGRPVPDTLIEIWQANAGGRYRHVNDGYLAALDPNFGGCGRVMSDGEGRYAFRTIRPGPYPWRNNGSDWRPAHIHLSIFGEAFAQRLVTQMYFPGDPLLDHDPIYNAVPEAAARERLIGRFDLEATRPEWALGYAFDIVLGGRRATPAEG